MTAQKFRKKPVEVEAMRLDNHTTPEQVARWCGGRVTTPIVGTGQPIFVETNTLEGVMLASPGDWIIKGVAGEFYPCKPDIFEQTYVAMSPPPTDHFVTDDGMVDTSAPCNCGPNEAYWLCPRADVREATKREAALAAVYEAIERQASYSHIDNPGALSGLAALVDALVSASVTEARA